MVLMNLFQGWNRDTEWTCGHGREGESGTN